MASAVLTYVNDMCPVGCLEEAFWEVGQHTASWYAYLGIQVTSHKRVRSQGLGPVPSLLLGQIELGSPPLINSISLSQRMKKALIGIPRKIWYATVSPGMVTIS